MAPWRCKLQEAVVRTIVSYWAISEYTNPMRWGSIESAVQECDATVLNSSNIAWLKKKLTLMQQLVYKKAAFAIPYKGAVARLLLTNSSRSR